MNRGCLIALVAFGICVLILIVTVVVVPLYMFDVIRSAPRVPVATFLTENSVAAIVVDPNHKPFLDLINQGGGNFGWFLPHEVGAIVDLDATRKTRTVTIAGSPKHLGPAIKMMFSDPNAFPASKMETAGIDTWLTPTLTSERGALILRGEGAVAPETETIAATHWPEAAPRTPIELEGGHALESVIQNEGGVGILALEPFFRVDVKEGDSSESSADAEAEDPNVEPSAESNPAAESEELPAESAAEMEKQEQESVLGLLLYASNIRLIGDFTDAGDFKLTLTARAKDAENAALAVELVDGLREVIRTEMEKDEISVTGATTVAGDVVTAEVIYSGYKERFATWLKQMQQSRY